MDLSNMEQGIVTSKSNVAMHSFIQQVEQQMKALALEQNLEVSVEKVRLPTSIMIEEELFIGLY